MNIFLLMYVIIRFLKAVAANRDDNNRGATKHTTSDPPDSVFDHLILCSSCSFSLFRFGPMSWATLKESTCSGVSEWRGCFVLRDGGATRTGSKQFSSCTSMPPRSLSYFSEFQLSFFFFFFSGIVIEWKKKKQTPCFTIKLVDQLPPHQSITQRYTITSEMLEGRFYQPWWFYLSGAELCLETLHYVI